MESKNEIVPINEQNILNDNEVEVDYYKLAEEKNIRQSLQSSYADRFKMMMVLMRIDNTLSKAKITHKKMLC